MTLVRDCVQRVRIELLEAAAFFFFFNFLSNKELKYKIKMDFFSYLLYSLALQMTEVLLMIVFLRDIEIIEE
jgi:hypothetical protein